VAVKKVWKLVNIWCSCKEYSGAKFLGHLVQDVFVCVCVCVCVCVSALNYGMYLVICISEAGELFQMQCSSCIVQVLIACHSCRRSSCISQATSGAMTSTQMMHHRHYWKDVILRAVSISVEHANDLNRLIRRISKHDQVSEQWAQRVIHRFAMTIANSSCSAHESICNITEWSTPIVAYIRYSVAVAVPNDDEHMLAFSVPTLL